MRKEHSKAYNDFQEWCTLMGTKEGHYYMLNLLDRIYDLERDEVEDTMYKTFIERRKGYYYFTSYMPHLKNYDGVKILKEALNSIEQPNDFSVEIAAVLYNETEDRYFFEALVNMYEVYDKHSVLFQLKRIIITEDSFNFIAERYIEEDDSALRGTTIGALLYHKGYFSSADGPTYSTKITRFFHFADIDTRRELVEKLRTGIHVEISKQDLFDLLAKQYIHDRNERVIFGLLNNEGYGEALGVAEKKKLARALTSLNIDKRKELVEKLRTGLPFEAPAKGIAKSTPKLIIKGNMERFRTSTSRYTDGNRHVYLRGLEENYDALLEIMRENECEILNTKDEKFVREAELLWKNQRIFLKYDDIIGTFFYTAEKEELPLLEELAGNVIARARELL